MSGSNYYSQPNSMYPSTSSQQPSFYSAAYSQPPPSYSQPPPSYSQQPSQPPPTKYIKIDGVMKINPEYKTYQASQGKPATTSLYPDQALPVVSNMEQHEEYCQASKQAGYGDIPLSAATESTIQMMQEPDICARVGLSTDAMVDGLGKIFVKHEAPMGLMNKLMGLSEYEELEFMIDDSGSMAENTNVKDKSGRFLTRWQEAQTRMKEMIEIMAYVPTPKITICFLNRRNIITLQRSGEPPETFIQNVCGQLDTIFQQGPGGTTPVLERLADSFRKGNNRRISRYLFCDGNPDGGDAAKEAITNMLKNRPHPENTPLTFLSCSDKDHEVEWMKEAEEIAPYCAEYDDFEDEAREILRDQGPALPFTKGFHLIGQLVGAMNPDDLDAMDESVPLTKYTLDNLLGIQTSEQEYHRYFDGFKNAQRNRRIETPLDRVKAGYNWDAHFNSFMTERVPKNIPGVVQFKRQLEQGSTSSQSGQSLYNSFMSWVK